MIKRLDSGRRIVGYHKNDPAESEAHVTGWAYHPDDVPVHRCGIQVEDAPDPRAPKGSNGHGAP